MIESYLHLSFCIIFFEFWLLPNLTLPLNVWGASRCDRAMSPDRLGLFADYLRIRIYTTSAEETTHRLHRQEYQLKPLRCHRWILIRPVLRSWFNNGRESLVDLWVDTPDRRYVNCECLGDLGIFSGRGFGVNVEYTESATYYNGTFAYVWIFHKFGVLRVFPLSVASVCSIEECLDFSGCKRSCLNYADNNDWLFYHYKFKYKILRMRFID